MTRWTEKKLCDHGIQKIWDWHSFANQAQEKTTTIREKNNPLGIISMDFGEEKKYILHMLVVEPP